MIRCRDRLLTGAEAALLCGVSRVTIRRWVHEHWLTPYVQGKQTRAHYFLESDVLIAEQRARSRRRCKQP